MVGCYPTIDWGMWSGGIVNLIRGHGYEGGQGHLVHVEETKMRPFSFTQVLAINNFLSLWIALLGFGLVWQPCYGRLVCSYLLWEGIQLAVGGAVGGKRIWHDSTSEQIIHLTSREMVNVVKTMMKMVIMMMVMITATIKVESRQFELFTVLVFPWINWCHRPHRENVDHRWSSLCQLFKLVITTGESQRQRNTVDMMYGRLHWNTKEEP